MNVAEETGCWVIVGKMGAGKTYCAVYWMLEALMAGRPVYSNIVLHWPECCRIFKAAGVEVPRSNLRELPHKRHPETGEDVIDPSNFQRVIAKGSLCVLDESTLSWNARDWKKTEGEQRDFLEFLPQARKNDVLTLFITQHEASIDAQINRQAQYFVKLVNFQKLWWWTGFLPPYTICNVLQPDGKTLYDRRWIRRGKYYKCYDTKQNFAGLKLTGAAAAPVVGKKKRQLYAPLLVGGMALVAAGRFTREEPAPGRPVNPAVPPETAALPVSGADGILYDHPEGPGYSWRWPHGGMICVAGRRIVPGSIYAGFPVRRINYDSPESVLLILENKSAIRIYDHRLNTFERTGARDGTWRGLVGRGVWTAGGNQGVEKSRNAGQALINQPSVEAPPEVQMIQEKK